MLNLDTNNVSPRHERSRCDHEFVLVLSGGNALGAFQAGVYEALHDHGMQPDWVIGASIGAINGAMIAGSAPERRVEVLKAFWQPDGLASKAADATWLPEMAETGRRTAAASWTMMAGRPGSFGPLLSSLLPFASPQPSLFETEQLQQTLEKTIDFDRLNGGGCRFTATAVDLETGDDVAFDTRERRVEARHIRASAALPITFPPVEIDGRWHVDGGLSANLPLDPLLAAAGPKPVLCIAVDLLPLAAALPTTVGEAASRMQDLIFAAQSRRTIARWQDHYAGRRDASIVLARLAYTDQAREVAGKAMDFSGATIWQRWEAGYCAAKNLIKAYEGNGLPIGSPGLHVTKPDAKGQWGPVADQQRLAP